jgi:hypothetical protein
MALRIKHRDSVNYASGYAAFHTLKTRQGGQTTTPDFEQVKLLHTYIIEI